MTDWLSNEEIRLLLSALWAAMRDGWSWFPDGAEERMQEKLEAIVQRREVEAFDRPRRDCPVCNDDIEAMEMHFEAVYEELMHAVRAGHDGSILIAAEKYRNARRLCHAHAR